MGKVINVCRIIKLETCLTFFRRDSAFSFRRMGHIPMGRKLFWCPSNPWMTDIVSKISQLLALVEVTFKCGCVDCGESEARGMMRFPNFLHSWLISTSLGIVYLELLTVTDLIFPLSPPPENSILLTFLSVLSTYYPTTTCIHTQLQLHTQRAFREINKWNFFPTLCTLSEPSGWNISTKSIKKKIELVKDWANIFN